MTHRPYLQPKTMKYFWYHNRILYSRLLWAAVLLLSLSGAISTVSAQVQSPDRQPTRSISSTEATKSRASAQSITTETTSTQTAPSGPANLALKAPVASVASSIISRLPPFGPSGSEDLRAMARGMSDARFGAGHFAALDLIWAHESVWNPGARNRFSGACGIPQALPCSKIPDMSPAGQIEWGLGYIASRYGNPTNAWRFWQSHRWY
jgi:hypothetical protein